MADLPRFKTVDSVLVFFSAGSRKMTRYFGLLESTSFAEIPLITHSPWQSAGN
jgi:hypothetical protein